MANPNMSPNSANDNDNSNKWAETLGDMEMTPNHNDSAAPNETTDETNQIDNIDQSLANGADPTELAQKLIEDSNQGKQYVARNLGKFVATGADSEQLVNLLKENGLVHLTPNESLESFDAEAYHQKLKGISSEQVD